MIYSKEGWNYNIKNSLISRGGVEILGLHAQCSSFFHHFLKGVKYSLKGIVK